MIATLRRFMTYVCAFLLVGASTACSYSSYERGLVKRVEVTKAVTDAVVSASASWTSADEGGAWQRRQAERGFGAALGSSKVAGAGAAASGTGAGAGGATGGGRALRIGLEREAAIDLTRTRAYNTIEWVASYHALFPLWELLELATAGLYILIIPPLVLLDIAPPQDKDFQIPGLSRLMIATAPLNPCVSIFGTTVSRTENVPEVRFRDPTEKVGYRSRLPVPETTFEFRLLDAAGKEVGRGTSRTDVFGEAYIEGAPEGTKAVDVRGEGGLQVTVRL